MEPRSREALSRRSFLSASGGSALAVLASGLLSCSRAEAEPLNALLIVCDDLNDSVQGMGGHPQAKTPNIARLMKQAVQFSNAHSNAPICAPARACLFSGIYPHHSGIIDFKPMDSSELLRNSVWLFEHFKNNGYEIFGAGKLHHYEREILKLFENPDGSTNYGPRTDYGPFPNNGEKANMEVLHPSLKWLEQYITDHDKKLWKARGEHSFAPLSDVPAPPKYPGWHGWAYGRGRKPMRYVSETDRDPMPDEMTAAYGAEVLSRPHDKPFLLGLGFIRPHTPLYAPKKYFDMFPPEELQLPPYKEDDLDDCQGFLKLILQYGFERHELYKNHGLWKRFLQAYLACTAFVDAQIGVVLDALERSPYADNTVVILTGDHGFHMGEKHYNFKLTNWEEATRVPLIVKAPGCRAGAACDVPVSHVDIYPTLIDYCGLPENPNAGRSGVPLDGHSLRPLVENPEAGQWDGPDVALIAVYGERKPEGGQYHNFSVRSRRWRYTLYENGAEELYDHQNDPNEWTNLAGVEKYAAVKAELKQKLLAMLGRKEAAGQAVPSG